jgi:hypothetical protein
MGLMAQPRRKKKELTALDRAILRHPDFYANHLNIGVTVEDIVDRINAFDWLDLAQADTPEKLSEIILKFFKDFNFVYPKAYEAIILQAFTLKFKKALEYLRDAIEHVSQSYNVEGQSRGFTNPAVDRMYYINYWATKKNIPVNFNEKKQERREIFNLDTIILSILADKLNNLNEFERLKPKK